MSTKNFKVSGSLNNDGPWELLIEGQLNKTIGKHALLVNFSFEEQVEIQYLRFELISFWGNSGGGLQYFGAILYQRDIHRITKQVSALLSFTRMQS